MDDSHRTVKGRAQAEIEVKKSRFIGQLAHAETEEDALGFLEEVRAANRMARHNVYAYVLREGGAGDAGRVRYSDDGEPQKTAGMPVLETLQHAGLTDVVCVVTRYFGGTLLGTGGLVRAYTQATQDAIAVAHVVTISRCVDIAITMDYAHFDQMAHLAQACGAKTVDTRYTDNVEMTVRMLAGTERCLLQKTTQLFRGNEHVRVSDPFDTTF